MNDVLNLFSDEELISAANDCERDLYEAAALVPNGERHESCFAALYLMAMEMNRRGIKSRATEVFQ